LQRPRSEHLQLADSLADGMAIEVERCGFVGLGAGGGGSR